MLCHLRSRSWSFAVIRLTHREGTSPSWKCSLQRVLRGIASGVIPREQPHRLQNPAPSMAMVRSREPTEGNPGGFGLK